MPNLLSLGVSPAHLYACRILEQQGYVIEKTPSSATQGVLTDIPTPSDTDLEGFVWNPDTACIPIFCGNIRKSFSPQFRTVDLLADPSYTAHNADITARCAIRLACASLDRTLLNLPVLVIGWGRIGKCLTKLLSALGADCHVYARNPEDLAILTALGYQAVTWDEMLHLLPHLALVINTAPELVLYESLTGQCPGLLMDLASKPGIVGQRVLWARGLPGWLAPESSGALIAQTVTRLWKEEVI